MNYDLNCNDPQIVKATTRNMLNGQEYIGESKSLDREVDFLVLSEVKRCRLSSSSDQHHALVRMLGCIVKI